MDKKAGIALVVFSFIAGISLGYFALPLNEESTPLEKPTIQKKNDGPLTILAPADPSFKQPAPKFIYNKENPNFLKEIQKVVKDILPDLTKCIKDWAALSSDFTGSLELTLLISQKGLKRAEAVEYRDLPEETHKCLQKHLYNTSWPATSEATSEISFPLRLSLSPAK